MLLGDQGADVIRIDPPGGHMRSAGTISLTIDTAAPANVGGLTVSGAGVGNATNNTAPTITGTARDGRASAWRCTARSPSSRPLGAGPSRMRRRSMSRVASRMSPVSSSTSRTMNTRPSRAAVRCSPARGTSRPAKSGSSRRTVLSPVVDANWPLSVAWPLAVAWRIAAAAAGSSSRRLHGRAPARVVGKACATTRQASSDRGQAGGVPGIPSPACKAGSAARAVRIAQPSPREALIWPRVIAVANRLHSRAVIRSLLAIMPLVPCSTCS